MRKCWRHDTIVHSSHQWNYLKNSRNFDNRTHARTLKHTQTHTYTVRERERGFRTEIKKGVVSHTKTRHQVQQQQQQQRCGSSTTTTNPDEKEEVKHKTSFHWSVFSVSHFFHLSLSLSLSLTLSLPLSPSLPLSLASKDSVAGALCQNAVLFLSSEAESSVFNEPGSEKEAEAAESPESSVPTSSKGVAQKFFFNSFCIRPLLTRVVAQAEYRINNCHCYRLHLSRSPHLTLSSTLIA